MFFFVEIDYFFYLGFILLNVGYIASLPTARRCAARGNRARSARARYARPEGARARAERAHLLNQQIYVNLADL